MNTMQASGPEGTCFELCFQSLVREGCGCAFPCDKDGHVDLDALSGRVRLSYLYARTLIGREFAMPAVLPLGLH